MIIGNIFDEKTNTDKTWYESSNILYSECVDNKDSLKTLVVTFKNGSTYQYNDVDVNDYVLFKHGGIDQSQGKAFHKHIKPKYEFVKLENRNVSLINEELETLKKNQV